MRRFLLQCLFMHLAFFANSQKISTADMLDNVMGSVVTVAVYQTDIAMKPLGFRGNPADLAYTKVLDLSSAKGSGSGFVISRNGKMYVITNAHVIQQAQSTSGSIYVYSIGYKKYEARVVGGDTFYDLAVLEFITPVGEEISAVKFRSSEIRLGEQVFAIGNPLGDYPYTVSDGIISAKNRVRDGLTGKFGFLQSTATVIWGNSGGPLVDVNGDVCGINSQIAFTQMGETPIWLSHINFALESGISQRLIDDIFSNNGLVKRAYIGVEIAKDVISSDKINYYVAVGTPADVNTSVILNKVIPGSPADGVLNMYVGYKIESANNESVRNVEDLLGVFERTVPGEFISFKLSKNNQFATVKVKTSTATAEVNSRIGELVLADWGGSTKQAKNGMQLSFDNKNKYASYQKNIPENFTELGRNIKATSDVLLNGQWMLVGAGISGSQNNQTWLVKDATDLGTALRLCGPAGGIDLTLFKLNSDPKNANNYFQKRFLFSGYNDIYKHTIWY